MRPRNGLIVASIGITVVSIISIWHWHRAGEDEQPSLLSGPVAMTAALQAEAEHAIRQGPSHEPIAISTAAFEAIVKRQKSPEKSSSVETPTPRIHHLERGESRHGLSRAPRDLTDQVRFESSASDANSLLAGE